MLYLMSEIMKFFKKYLMTHTYEKNCYTDFSQFKKLIWDTQFNDTVKATLFKIYLEQSRSEIYTDKLLHLCSNECMSNHIFAQQLVREKTYIIMFEKAKLAKTKWLMYSSLWNLFRYEDLRIKVKKNFVLKIINDIQNIITMQDKKVLNVYIGCLSNLALFNQSKVLINDMLINLNDKQINELLKIDINFISIFTSLFGLICNISVDDNLGDTLINSKLNNFILSHLNEIINLIDNLDNNEHIIIRNALSYLNNIMNHDKMIKLFIKHNLFDSFLKFENILNDMDTNHEFFNTLNTILPSIKDILHIVNFSETTKLHLANDWDEIYYILNSVIKNNVNINITDELGNTILHNALKLEKLNNAKFYILFNANINQLNNESETPQTLNTEFVNNILIKKNKIHTEYEKKIRKKVNNEFHLKKYPYEKFIINEINNFIDIRPDIYNLQKYLHMEM
jgi:hypothetical protein